jgi:hypothetical protein
VVEIAECTGIREGEILLNPLYSFDPERGLISTGNALQRRGKLKMHGLDGKGESEEK